MKPISIYRPSSVEEAIQILSLHGTQAGVYAGGTDLLIQLKNRIEAAPSCYPSLANCACDRHACLYHFQSIPPRHSTMASTAKCSRSFL
jgi:hypothetical protein